MKVHPTATCFDDAMYYIAWLLVTDPEFDPDAYRIVHGVCLLPDDTPYAHAWIEKDGVEAIGCGLIDGDKVYFYADRRDYYKEFRMQELIRYTLSQVAARKTGGPWEPKFKKLCKE
jgi:hypothetical protein